MLHSSMMSQRFSTWPFVMRLPLEALKRTAGLLNDNYREL